ncbi:MAG: DUF429 domain-containing protein [Anaerolineales bacterium]|nr:DUF429 domain-containing protein [Anaerolineales bacterium]
MLFADTVFVGVDPTAGSRPIHYAALNAKLELVVLDHGDRETVLAFLAGLDRAMVAVNAPQGVNQGWLKNDEVRRRFNLRTGSHTWSKWRVCEYDLRRRNIRLYNTPSEESKADGWVREGFSFYRRLKSLGYCLFRQGEAHAEREMMECQPHAAYVALLHHRPFLKHSIEGRIQRQLVLFMNHIDLPNPMHCLEEVTRHHLLSGHLPLEELHTPEELDALVAALTAYRALHQPDQVSQYGEPQEGMITLPVAGLRDYYPST